MNWQPMASAPKDGREVELLVHHLHWRYAVSDEDKQRWEQVVRAHWIEHNGGGWTWHGMMGRPIGWREIEMANPREIKRTVTISATPEVWRKLDRFFALLHYNAGHTAVFGLPFDGDGADSFRIDPPPPEELRRPAQRIGDASGSLEIANEGSYVSRHVKPLPFYILRRGETGDELIAVSEPGGPEGERVLRRYDH